MEMVKGGRFREIARPQGEKEPCLAQGHVLYGLHQLWVATLATRSSPSAGPLGILWGAVADRPDDLWCQGGVRPGSGRGNRA